MLLFVIFDEKKNRIGVWFSCSFSGFLAIGTYIVTYGADEKSCCQRCRFSYLWCYCLWCNLVTKSKSSCQWCTLASGAVTNDFDSSSDFKNLLNSWAASQQNQPNGTSAQSDQSLLCPYLECLFVVCSGFTSLSTIFQSYHDGVW